MRISLSVVAALGLTWPAAAALAPALGYLSAVRYTSSAPFTLIGGLSIESNRLYFGEGQMARSMDLADYSVRDEGALPPNVSISFVERHLGRTYVACGTSFNPPFPYLLGYLDAQGVFTNVLSLNGAFDSAALGPSRLVLVANPGGMDSRLYQIQNGLFTGEIANPGGYSGGVAAAGPQGVYYAEQTLGRILRIEGSATTVVAGVAATYLAAHPDGTLYATRNFGNDLARIDPQSGAVLGLVATDDATNFGLGKILWDPTGSRLFVVFTDFAAYRSTIHEIVRSPGAGPYWGDDAGVPMASGAFRGWIRDVLDYTHPANSGGYARDDEGNPVSPAEAVRGRPRDASATNDANTAHVLSLGNGGEIVLEMDEPIYDGPGPDFAVFENGFTDDTPRPGDSNRYTFAELAFVEVGSATSAWARFPSSYLGTGLVFNLNYAPSNHYASQDVTFIDGLAGKVTMAYGVAFDLARLRADTNVVGGAVDLSSIRYVRLVDVVGDGSAHDAAGRPIYDPYYNFLTGYPNAAAPSVTDGFDLRAVGIIHVAEVVHETKPGVLTWFAASNMQFQVQYTDDMSHPAWTNLGSWLDGADAALSVTDTLAGAAMRTYRVARRSHAP